MGKESAYNAGNLGSTPGLGRSPGEGSDAPPRCSCLKNPMDRGASNRTVHEVTASNRAGAIWSCPTHCRPVDCSPAGCSVLGILQTGILGWVAVAFSIYLQYRSPGFSPWGRKNPCRGTRLPTPVFSPGKSHFHRWNWLDSLMSVLILQAFQSFGTSRGGGCHFNRNLKEEHIETKQKSSKRVAFCRW